MSAGRPVERADAVLPVLRLLLGLDESEGDHNSDTNADDGKASDTNADDGKAGGTNANDTNADDGKASGTNASDGRASGGNDLVGVAR